MKIHLTLIAFISCTIYCVTSIHQSIVTSMTLCLSSPAVLEMIGAILFLFLLASGAIAFLWTHTHRMFHSQSLITQSVVFRVVLLPLLLALAFLGLRMNGSPLFLDVLEHEDYFWTAFFYIFDGIIFASLHFYYRKSNLLALPAFLIYIVVSRVAMDGLEYYQVYTQMPSYCENAAPNSIPSIVCQRLGNDIPRLVKSPSAFYGNFMGMYEMIGVEEISPSGEHWDAEVIIATCQHELGHRKNHDEVLFKSIEILGAMMPAVCAQILLDSPAILASILAENVDLIPVVAYTISEMITSVIRSYLRPLTLALSRYFEFQADLNVVATGHVQPFLRYLGDEATSSKVPPLQRILRYHHPPHQERIARMKECL